MTLTDQEKIKYYKNQERAKQIVLAMAAKKGHKVYGAKAINAHLPPHLDKFTEDFDIYADNPKTTAEMVEDELDEAYGGDYFKVVKAKYPKTWKVKSNVTGRTVVDYTKPEEKVPTKNILGVNYATPGYLKKAIKQSLNKPSAAFRFDKDKEALQRIKLAQKSKVF